MYPHCLFFLELLQNANFRNAMAHPTNKELAHRQQYFFWKNYRNNRLKHIIPRPPPEPAPSQAPATLPLQASVPTPVAPPVPAPTSSMPPVVAGGASAMSPMQFVGTPGTNMPKNDMRNAMDNRKRKMG
nr:unknown [Zea mays]